MLRGGKQSVRRKWIEKQSLFARCKITLRLPPLVEANRVAVCHNILTGKTRARTVVSQHCENDNKLVVGYPLEECLYYFFTTVLLITFHYRPVPTVRYTITSSICGRDTDAIQRMENEKKKVNQEGRVIMLESVLVFLSHARRTISFVCFMFLCIYIHI